MLAGHARIPAISRSDLSEQSPEERERVLQNQERMIEALGNMHEDLINASKVLEEMTKKMSGAFWGLMKVPVAVTIVAAASWAFLYMQRISETTWLVILGVAVFPWFGESVTAIAGLIRGRDK
jgi:hypothetical protein